MTASIPSRSPGHWALRSAHALLVQTAVFVSIITGALVLNGYAFLEKRYLVQEVPISRLNVSWQTFASYGWANFSARIEVVVVLVALSALVALIIALCTSSQTPEQPLPKWMTRLQQRLQRWNGFARLVAGALLLAFVWVLLGYSLIGGPAADGKRAALNQIRNCVPQTYRYANTATYQGCFIAETDDTLYLSVRLSCDANSVTFKPLRLAKAGLLSGESQPITLSRDDEAQACPQRK